MSLPAPLAAAAPAARARVGAPGLVPALGALSSAALLTLASPAHGQAWLGWVALLPFLAGLARVRTARRAAAWGALLGASLTLGVYPWLVTGWREFLALPTPAGVLLLPAWGALTQLQLPAFAALWVRTQGLRERAPVRAALLLSAAYAGLDWAAPKLFPDTLGQVLWATWGLRQVVDVGGAAGLTALLVLGNLGLLSVLGAGGARPWRHALRPGVAAAGVALAALAYGAVREAAWAQALAAPARTVRVAVVQANIGHFDKVAAEQGVRAAVEGVLGTYGRLTGEALEHAPRPQLVVWPETAYPTAFRAHRNAIEDGLDARLEASVAWGKVPLVFGGYGVEGAQEFNSAFLLSPGGELGVYRKRRPLPFAEALPFEGALGFLRGWFPAMAAFGKGQGPASLPLQLPDGGALQVAPLICYEALFNAHAREGVGQGAQLLLNLTNDSWFLSEAQARLHLALAALRSIETRRPQVRATNTGLTALVLPNGDVVGRTHYDTEQVAHYEVPLVQSEASPLQRFGDRAGLLFLLLATVGLVTAARTSQPRPPAT